MQILNNLVLYFWKTGQPFWFSNWKEWTTLIHILTQCCLHYLNQTHQKLGDLKEKLGCFIWKSVSVTFLDFSFYHNFSFCCVFFMAHELALSGTLLYTFTHPLRTLYNCEVRVTETEKKMQNIEVTQKLKSFYKVSNWKLRVFKHFAW